MAPGLARQGRFRRRYRSIPSRNLTQDGWARCHQPEGSGPRPAPLVCKSLENMTYISCGPCARYARVWTPTRGLLLLGQAPSTTVLIKQTCRPNCAQTARVFTNLHPPDPLNPGLIKPITAPARRVSASRQQPWLYWPRIWGIRGISSSGPGLQDHQRCSI